MNLSGWISLAALALTGSAFAQNSETGELGVYASQYRGLPTASGELYDAEALTAAHRTLPFGTTVRVANFETGRMIDVRINDRKQDDGRIVTLSHAAAARIGLVENRSAPGSTLVVTAPVSPVPTTDATRADRKFEPFGGLQRELATRQATAGGVPGEKKGLGSLFGKKQEGGYAIPAHQYQPYVERSAITRTVPAVSTENQGGGLAGLFKGKKENPVPVAPVVASHTAPPVGGAPGEIVVPLSAQSRNIAIPGPEALTRPPAPPVIPQPAAANQLPYRVQFGAFRRTANARELQEMLGQAGIPTFIAPSNGTALELVITHATFTTAEQAQQWIDYEGARRGWTDRPVVIR